MGPVRQRVAPAEPKAPPAGAEAPAAGTPTESATKTTAKQPPAPRAPWAKRLGIPLGIFAASRAAMFAVYFFALRLPVPPTPGYPPAERFLGYWDGAYYEMIAKGGYPAALAPAPIHNVHAFFPLFPLAIRAVHSLTGLSYLRAALAVNMVSAAVAMVVIWALMERLADARAASRTVALLCFFPWAFIFSIAYSEGLLILLAAICLLALLDEHWLVAGLAAALAGAARPNGFVLALPCAWAAFVAIRKRRDWWALLAPVLAPLGILAFFGYLRVHTGNFWANLTARDRGWAYSGIGFHPHAAVKVIHDYLANPSADLNRSGSVVTIVLILVALVVMAMWRPPAILWLYVLPVIGLALLFDTYASIPRFTLTAFPLLAALAWRLRGPAFWALIGVSATLMATLFIVVGTTLAFTP